MSEYTEDSYVFFKNYEQFNNVIKDKTGPWYFCDIHAIATFDDGRVNTLNVTGLKIAKWWKENKDEKSLVFYQASDGVKRLIFNEENIALKFNKWYRQQTITGNHKNIELWPSPSSFLILMDNVEEFHVEAKVKVGKLFNRYNCGKLTEEIFDVYCWIEDNIDTVYHNDDIMYFKNRKDATAFKLKWSNEPND